MNCVVNLNKPENISSHQAVIKVKRFFNVKKAGHAGTLDPMATGVLLICLNEATKVVRFLSELDKEYNVELKLGERTDTYDSTGRIIERFNVREIKETEISQILNNFKGLIKQKPPMYSAIKIGGKRLYKLARIGLDIDRPERVATIYDIKLLQYNFPFVSLKVSCSKGTYMRTLCDDIGKTLGVGAHLVSLERTRIGKFRIEDSASMEEVQTKKAACHTIDSALSHLREIILDKHSFLRARNGVTIIVPDEMPGRKYKKNQSEQYVRLKNPEKELFGIGKFTNGSIKIERLLNQFLRGLK